MTETLLSRTLERRNDGTPPVWLMRQAGRYHAHYQALRRQHSFVEMCKTPTLAAEIAMGPMREFGFDAAILFSDLLFPLEALGQSLAYIPGPHLEPLVRTVADARALHAPAADALDYQAAGVRLTRSLLPPDKALIGFAGAAWTLFVYAVEGRHQGELASARAGLEDGRWQVLSDLLIPAAANTLIAQARAGADTVAIFDTCAGALSPAEYARTAGPAVRDMAALIRRAVPSVKILYYSRETGPDHWKSLENSAIDALGIDWRNDLVAALERFGDRFALQGNVDPEVLTRSGPEMEAHVREAFEKVRQLPRRARRGWIAGLGHGVLQTTPEANVRRYVAIVREMFE